MNVSHPQATGTVTGAPRIWLRIEGAAVLALALYVYQWGGHSWLLFALLFLLPDVSLAGYLAGPRAGAMLYNSAHSYVGPVIAALVAATTGRPAVVATIWAAHIGFDRLLGFGLKYPTAFADTHLGRIGR
jgi:hypothetical protein